MFTSTSRVPTKYESGGNKYESCGNEYEVRVRKRHKTFNFYESFLKHLSCYCTRSGIYKDSNKVNGTMCKGYEH